MSTLYTDVYTVYLMSTLYTDVYTVYLMSTLYALDWMILTRRVLVRRTLDALPW